MAERPDKAQSLEGKTPPEQDEAAAKGLQEVTNILRQLKARIFEAEKPETEAERERIAFFQRLGGRYKLRQREKLRARSGQVNPRQQLGSRETRG